MSLNVALVCFGLMLGSALLVLAAAKVNIHKCDPTMLDKIKKLRCEYGRPGCLLERYSCNTWCKINTTNTMYQKPLSYSLTNYTRTGDNTGIARIHNVFEDGTVVQFESTITESCGSFDVYENGYKWIPVWMNGGVAVEYLCNSREDAKEGPCAFAVSVNTNQTEVCPKSLQRAHCIMQRLGWKDSDLNTHVCSDCTA